MKKKTKPKWFIGQQWGTRFPLMPAVLIFASSITSRKCKKKVGVRCQSWLLEFQKNKTIWRVREDWWGRFCHRCFLMVKKNPQIQKKLVKEFKKRTPAFLKFCRDVYRSDLRQKSKKELWRLYEKYIRLYEDIYIWGEMFAFGARFELADYLKEYLKKKGGEKEIEAIFNLLITPPEKPFTLEEREALLKMAIKIEKNRKYKKLFLKNLKTIQKNISRYPTLNRLIEKHTQDWQWVPYNYGAYLFDQKHFLGEISELVKKKKAQKELKELQEKYRTLGQKQEKIVNQWQIDRYHQKILTALRFNGFIIDYKKKIFTISHFYINFSLMEEIARRLKIKQELAHCLLAKEMKEALILGKMPPLKILQGRARRSVAFISRGKVELAGGRQAGKFLKKFNLEKISHSKIKEIKGQPAFSGLVQGRVKIIPGPGDFAKMKRGNILVTYMTTPEFTPILKKVKAIVTDEGGITCHAAIVAREMKKPCIIGTKVATQVLKDGDRVEVDANQGIVKIIKKIR